MKKKTLIKSLKIPKKQMYLKFRTEMQKILNHTFFENRNLVYDISCQNLMPIT